MPEGIGYPLGDQNSPEKRKETPVKRLKKKMIDPDKAKKFMESFGSTR